MPRTCFHVWKLERIFFAHSGRKCGDEVAELGIVWMLISSKLGNIIPHFASMRRAVGADELGAARRPPEGASFILHHAPDAQHVGSVREQEDARHRAE